MLSLSLSLSSRRIELDRKVRAQIGASAITFDRGGIRRGKSAVKKFPRFQSAQTRRPYLHRASSLFKAPLLAFRGDPFSLLYGNQSGLKAGAQTVHDFFRNCEYINCIDVTIAPTPKKAPRETVSRIGKLETRRNRRDGRARACAQSRRTPRKMNASSAH